MTGEPRITAIENSNVPPRLTIVFDIEAAPTIVYEGSRDEHERLLEWFFADEARGRFLVDAMRLSGMTDEEIEAWEAVRPRPADGLELASLVAPAV